MDHFLFGMHMELACIIKQRTWDYLFGRVSSGIIIFPKWAETKRFISSSENLVLNFDENHLIQTAYLAEQYYYRSSCPKVVCEKGVLKNFAIFTGNIIHNIPFIIKLQVLENF